MKNKDKTCEICKCSSITMDEHHIQSKGHGGDNNKKNRCIICPNCHRKVHEGEIIIEGRYFTTGCDIGGTELIYRNRGEGSITGNKDPEVWRIGK